MPKTRNLALVPFRLNWPRAEHERLRDYANRVAKPIVMSDVDTYFKQGRGLMSSNRSTQA
jgi:hypothetical protein